MKNLFYLLCFASAGFSNVASSLSIQDVNWNARLQSAGITLKEYGDTDDIYFLSKSFSFLNKKPFENSNKNEWSLFIKLGVEARFHFVSDVITRTKEFKSLSLTPAFAFGYEL